MLKNSTRNSAPNRSLNLKLLNTEKSTFLKAESRKMFRPMVPNVPFRGGVITELPFMKQPAAASVLGSGATLTHAAGSALTAVTMPVIPDVDVQLAPLELAVPSRLTVKPLHHGMELGPDLKSLGLPKKSQRSLKSPCPLPPVLISWWVSNMSHGWEV